MLALFGADPRSLSCRQRCGAGTIRTTRRKPVLPADRRSQNLFLLLCAAVCLNKLSMALLIICTLSYTNFPRIQSSSLETICQALDKSNRTNTWQKKGACVVEQCLSALALYLHRRPEVRAGGTSGYVIWDDGHIAVIAVILRIRQRVLGVRRGRSHCNSDSVHA